MSTYEITVANTDELEKYYDLEHYSDNMKVWVRGGLDGKAKYDNEKYNFRTTYPLGQLKQILSVMHGIESGINPQWSELTKAKYVYDTLGGLIKYSDNKDEYKEQQSSNLSAIVSREGICAGYSLIFKEMMDRQGIKCDYVRGTATNSKGRTEKHAWNVLQIDGKNIPVDLTWDSPKIRKGDNVHFFGNCLEFDNTHRPDRDEITYYYTYLTEQDLKRAEYYGYQQPVIPMNKDTSRQEIDSKKEILENTIYMTYKKQANEVGPEKAKKALKTALTKYIKEGNANCFTRDGLARNNLTKNLTPENAMFCIADEYVERLVRKTKKEPIPEGYGEMQLKNGVSETIMTYDSKQARKAIIEYSNSGNTAYFTNRGASKARTNLKFNISKEDVFEHLVDEMIESTIERKIAIEKNIRDNINNHLFKENSNKTIMFDEEDFELTEPPKDDFFERAVKWISDRQKTKEKDDLKER